VNRKLDGRTFRKNPRLNFYETKQTSRANASRSVWSARGLPPLCDFDSIRNVKNNRFPATVLAQ
jgi:hypothetical protein